MWGVLRTYSVLAETGHAIARALLGARSRVCCRNWLGQDQVYLRLLQDQRTRGPISPVNQNLSAPYPKPTSSPSTAVGVQLLVLPYWEIS